MIPREGVERNWSFFLSWRLAEANFVIPREGVERNSPISGPHANADRLVIPREGVESSSRRPKISWGKLSTVIPREGVESLATEVADIDYPAAIGDPERGS